MKYNKHGCILVQNAFCKILAFLIGSLYGVHWKIRLEKKKKKKKKKSHVIGQELKQVLLTTKKSLINVYHYLCIYNKNLKFFRSTIFKMEKKIFFI